MLLGLHLLQQDPRAVGHPGWKGHTRKRTKKECDRTHFNVPNSNLQLLVQSRYKARSRRQNDVAPIFATIHPQTGIFPEVPTNWQYAKSDTMATATQIIPLQLEPSGSPAQLCTFRWQSVHPSVGDSRIISASLGHFLTCSRGSALH